MNSFTNTNRPDLGLFQAAIIALLVATAWTEAVNATADGPDYFRVTGVESGDMLNIRIEPNAQAGKIGEIPPGSNCVRNLGCQGGLTYQEFTSLSKQQQKTRLKENPHWCRIEYQETTGWVAGHYLAEGDCPSKQEEGPDKSANLPEWVERSNAIAYKVMESNAQFEPESSGQMGVSGYDEEIYDLGENLFERQIKNDRDNLKMLAGYLAKETNPRVRQDIGIMIKATEDSIESKTIEYERVLPYSNITGLIFDGFNGQLDKQVPFERQKAALVRLGKYTGQEEGYVPLTERAKILLTERNAVPGLIKPYRGEVEQDLERAPTLIAGMREVFEATDLTGWEDTLLVLQSQLGEYNDWVKAEILPSTRDTAALPRELYELQLKNYGVDASPEELMNIGQVAFMNIRNEMIALAPLVAKEKGYKTDDYREVIKLLKKEQVHGDALMEGYVEVMKEIDVITKEQHLLTLPNEPARVRMATAAETAQQPIPHLAIPQLIGNTGEFPEFIVPKIKQNEDGSWPQSDFAFPAVMWTLSAHEARPGHEMQFTTMLRGGVSTARAVFAFNSANVEGWALYAESITKPYMPLEGQMISLNARQLRAARIWLDPMLNLGLTTADEAKRVLMEEVVNDELSAQTEIDRYTFRSPAQATAYYYGYEKLLSLRARTEMKLKDKFKAQEFHDFILAQGLLPPDVLDRAVTKEFIAPKLK